MNWTSIEPLVSNIELHVWPSTVEKARTSHVRTRSVISGPYLEYLVIKIDLVQDEVITYFFQDDEATMVEKRSFVDALLTITDASTFYATVDVGSTEQADGLRGDQQ